MHLVLINDWSTWLGYRNSQAYSEYDTILTESPAILEASRRSHQSIDLSSMFSDAATDQIALDGLQIGNVWREALNEWSEATNYEVRIGHVLGKNLPYMLISTLHKWYVLREVLKRYEDHVSIIIPVLKGDDWKYLANTKLSDPQDNWYQIFAERIGDARLRVVSVDCTRAEARGLGPDVANEGPVNKFLYFCLRGLIFFEARLQNRFYWHARFVRSWVNYFFNVSENNSVRLILFLPNELIDHTLSALQKVWYEIIKLPVANGLNLEKHSIIEVDKIKSVLTDQGFDKEIQTPLEICRESLTNHLQEVVFPKVAWMEKYCDDLGLCKEEKIKSVLFTNGFGSSSDHIVGQQLQNRGVQVISFQHGLVGLMKFYNFYGERYGPPSFADKCVVFSKFEKEYYRSMLSNQSSTKFVIKNVSIGRQFLSRFTLRYLIRYLWSALGQHMVLYAPTLFHQGIMWPHDRRDNVYWHIQKELISVFGEINSRVVVKLHQKSIDPGTTRDLYLDRRHPLEEIELPENVTTKMYPLLDYSCFSGDILIIDHATSTIQAAIMSGVPLIYLDLPCSPLNENVVEAFRKAIFLVDLKSGDWKTKLKSLLCMDMNDLQRIWNEKESYRKEFIEEYIDGSDGEIRELVSVFNPQSLPS